MGLFTKAQAGRLAPRETAKGLFEKASSLRSGANQASVSKKKEADDGSDRLRAVRALISNSAASYVFPFELFDALREASGNPDATLLRLDRSKALYEAISVVGFDRESVERQLFPESVVDGLFGSSRTAGISGQKLSNLRPFFSPSDYARLEDVALLRMGKDYAMLSATSASRALFKDAARIAEEAAPLLDAVHRMTVSEREIVAIPSANLPDEILERAERYKAIHLLAVEMDCADLLRAAERKFPNVPAEVLLSDAFRVFSRIIGFSGDVFPTEAPRGIGVMYLQTPPDPELLLRQMVIAFDRAYRDTVKPIVLRSFSLGVEDAARRGDLERFCGSSFSDPNIHRT